MSRNSDHINNRTIENTYRPAEVHKNEILVAVLNQDYGISRNSRNAGNTAFDESDVEIAYMKAGGWGTRAARIAGYSGQQAYLMRLRNFGPNKLIKIHLRMKVDKLQAPMTTGRGGRYPIFYTFERLLELWFGASQYKASVPGRLRNWVPEEGSFWDHWWKDRG